MKVAYSVLAARSDMRHLRKVVEHQVQASCYDFSDRFIVMDTAPLSGERYENKDIPTQQDFEALCQQMVEDGIVDRVIPVNYDRSIRDPIMKKHLGSQWLSTHDFRGGPIYPLLFGYEQAQNADYFLHFDSDVFLHQPMEASWVKNAISLMEEYENILTATPLPGPPTPTGALKKQDIDYVGGYEKDERGFYVFEAFTARRHLLHCDRYETLLPLPREHISWKRRLWTLVFGGSALWSWEKMVGKALEDSSFIRADLIDPGSWTLHALHKDEWFYDHLEEIIERVEKGTFPEDQRGNYDLANDAWKTKL